LNVQLIRIAVQTTSDVADRDVWAVGVVEGSGISEQLKADWFWATWPDRVEFVFPVNADAETVQSYAREAERIIASAESVVGVPRLTIEAANGA
jgi:hypothetical protein